MHLEYIIKWFCLLINFSQDGWIVKKITHDTYIPPTLFVLIQSPFNYKHGDRYLKICYKAANMSVLSA